jgi:putative hemolysin
MNIVILLLLIVLNGLFAMAEIAVVSSSRLRLQQLDQEGSLAARRALQLVEAPDRFLATVQIGITLVGVFAGAFGGATLSVPLAALLARIPWLAQVSEPLAFGLVVAVITYVSLVVGELAPKRIGLNNPERIAMALAGAMNAVSVVAAPLVSFLSASTSAFLWLLRFHPEPEVEISEEEIDFVIAKGRQAGVIEPAEQEIIENAFWLGERRVNAIMTPRPAVHWLDVNTGTAGVLDLVHRAPHSRYLVCDGELDRVIGYVTSTDLLTAGLAGEGIDLRSLLLQPLIVPETLSILVMLDRFRSSGTHLAGVLDEYGGLAGLVTLNDILEELVGEVVQSVPGELPLVVQVSDGAWSVSGALRTREFLELLSLGDEVDLSADGYQTVGGFVTTRLGRLPAVGDGFRWRTYDIAVTEMDGLRVGRVQVSSTV